MTGPGRRDTAKAMAALGLVASFAPTLLRRGRREQAAISVAAAAMGAGAGAATEMAVLRLAAHLDGDETLARGTLVGLGAVAALAELPASPSSGVALAGTAARTAGIAAAVGSLTPVRRARGRHDRRAYVAAGGAVMAAAAVWRLRSARGRRRARRLRPRDLPVSEWLATVSGGEGSLVPRAALDSEGSRFLAAARPAAAGGVDPIRVFVGLRHAASVQERCRLAVDELERLGAFGRGRIVVCSATLRGYVNPVVVEAEEALAEGDVASVVVQYFDRKTPLMPLKVPIAAQTHRELLRELAGRDGVPEVVVYGESLGAWASQDVFRTGGVHALDGLRVSRALWIGTPAFSRLRRDLERGRIPSDKRMAVVRARDVRDADPPDAERLRFVLFHRTSDPVVLFNGLELIWRKPPWLRERDWTPGVTFLQLVGDLFRATNWPRQAPRALAHDYRLESPVAVNLAFGHGAGRARLRVLADQLIEREVARRELYSSALITRSDSARA